MAHILTLEGRERDDDAEELVLLSNVPDEISVDLDYFSVPNDAAFLKYFTPNFIASNGSKPRYMCAGGEFDAPGPTSTFPAYLMSGFGLLDACLHAYATNATLVLHPLDIILSVCYAYGNQRKRPVYNNNEELQKSTQIALKQSFTRANLLLALIAKLARRVETFPLGKLYSLLNTELNSPDPLVVRLVLGVLSYLAATRDTTAATIESLKTLFDLHEHRMADRLLESPIPTRAMSTGLLDVRHDPNAPLWGKLGSRGASSQLRNTKSSPGDPETATLVEATPTATSAVTQDFANRKPLCSADMPLRRMLESQGKGTPPRQNAQDTPPRQNAQDTPPRQNAQDTPPRQNAQDIPPRQNAQGTPPRQNAQDTPPRQNAQGTPPRQNAQGAAAVPQSRPAPNPLGAAATPQSEETAIESISDSFKILANWKLGFDSNTADEEGEGRGEEEGSFDDDAVAYLRSLRVSSILRGEGSISSVRSSVNNSNISGERDAIEWIMKQPRVPSRLYRLRKENGLHSVLFKGNQRAWLELPEALLELCQFFGLDKKLQSEIISIALMLQKSRLNISAECRSWWSLILFREGFTSTMPDGDILINGWLSVLLGDRVISEYCSMTVNRLCDLKTGVKLPVLLVRLPPNSMTDSDDVVLDSDVSLRKTRLHYQDDFRDKLRNSSCNADEIPVGLFMPWRSCDALNRTRRLWRQVGGDAPLMSRSNVAPPWGVDNRNNIESALIGRKSGIRQQSLQEEVSVKMWVGRHGATSLRSSMCSCCSRRMRRRLKDATEPLYNMSCLLSGIGGFCLQQAEDGSPDTGMTGRTCVRPLCFVELVHEG